MLQFRFFFVICLDSRVDLLPGRLIELRMCDKFDVLELESQCGISLRGITHRSAANLKLIKKLLFEPERNKQKGKNKHKRKFLSFK